MKRLIGFAFWMLILAWVVAWVAWATDHGELPPGIAWTLVALGAWWLFGASVKEGPKRN